MARVKSAVAGEGILTEEEAASHTVCGGGQTAQDVIRVSNMDGKIDLSTP
jgi:hypothetical protein